MSLLSLLSTFQSKIYLMNSNFINHLYSVKQSFTPFVFPKGSTHSNTGSLDYITKNYNHITYKHRNHEHTDRKALNLDQWASNAQAPSQEPESIPQSFSDICRRGCNNMTHYSKKKRIKFEYTLDSEVYIKPRQGKTLIESTIQQLLLHVLSATSRSGAVKARLTTDTYDTVKFVIEASLTDTRKRHHNPVIDFISLWSHFAANKFTDRYGRLNEISSVINTYNGTFNYYHKNTNVHVFTVTLPIFKYEDNLRDTCSTESDPKIESTQAETSESISLSPQAHQTIKPINNECDRERGPRSLDKNESPLPMNGSPKTQNSQTPKQDFTTQLDRPSMLSSTDMEGTVINSKVLKHLDEKQRSAECLSEIIKIQERTTRAIDNCKTLISSRHSDPTLSIGDLVSVAHLSERQLARQFQRALGQSPLQYLTEFRLEKAKALLKEGLRVNEAAVTVGFNSANYFSRQYKKYYGVSPSQDRVSGSL